MLLTVDIGNTSTKFGIFDGDRLTAKLSIPTIQDATAAGLAKVLRSRITSPVTAAMVCSVVPGANTAMLDFLTYEYGIAPLLVSNDLDFGLKINYEPLSAAGADRLVNASAASQIYGVPCIICSFGTALTIDAVSQDRVLLGGIIAPGMATMAKALQLNTARLPDVEIERPDAIIQNTTAGSIRSGVFYGYLALAEGLIKRIKDELGGDPQVIATGGDAAMIAKHSDAIDVVDNDLLLNGLRLLSERLLK